MTEQTPAADAAALPPLPESEGFQIADRLFDAMALIEAASAWVELLRNEAGADYDRCGMVQRVLSKAAALVDAEACALTSCQVTPRHPHVAQANATEVPA